jgi:hypothetical protein
MKDPANFLSKYQVLQKFYQNDHKHSYFYILLSYGASHWRALTPTPSSRQGS